MQILISYTKPFKSYCRSTILITWTHIVSFDLPLPPPLSQHSKSTGLPPHRLPESFISIPKVIPEAKSIIEILAACTIYDSYPCGCGGHIIPKGISMEPVYYFEQ